MIRCKDSAQKLNSVELDANDAFS